MDQNIDLPNLLRSRLTMVATLSALKAGGFLRKHFGDPISFSTKPGRHNLVTEMDTQAEQMIIEFIKSHFPDHHFLAEESGESGDNQEGILWVIDPLDGTVNYAHQIPFFSVSVAATFQGDVLAGAVYSPMSEELFTGEKGNGAYLNGKKLKTTQTAVLDSAIIATGLPYNVTENPLCCLEHFTKFARMGVPIRRIGSAALDLAYIAAGRFDMFWEVALRPWDYAAAKLFIEESGGRITDFSGKPLDKLQVGPIIASNGILHDQTVKHIQGTLQKFATNEAP
ncbi:MAG: inositol monophosphatase family protein [Chlamydiota bacterium]